MDDVLVSVEVLEGEDGLDEEVPDFVLGPALLLLLEDANVLAERCAIDELHDNVEAVVFFERLEITDDVGVFEIVADYCHFVDNLAWECSKNINCFVIVFYLWVLFTGSQSAVFKCRDFLGYN